MRRLPVLVRAVSAFSLAWIATTASADQFFFDDFDGPSFSSNLVDVEGMYFFSGGKTGTSASRSYVRTADGGYASIDFRADLIYSISGSGGAPGIFFGIGAGTEDAGFFEEPEAALYLLDHTNGFTFFPNSDVVVRVNASGPGVITDLANVPFPDGTSYARMTKIGDSITFAFDYAYDGVSFTPDGSHTASLSAVAPFLGSGPSYLLFGTGLSASRFDSILVVVPEPSSLALLGAGTLALACCARRRRGRQMDRDAAPRSPRALTSRRPMPPPRP
jgi:hypothetical protein